MSEKFTGLTPELYAYVVRMSVRDDDVLAKLAEETAGLGPLSRMQIAPDEGTFLTLLVRAIGARSAIEIGTFTGASAIAIARGLPQDGRLLCCDVSDEWTAIARRYFRAAALEAKIELRIAPAIETLRALSPSTRFDFAFLDADKTSYAAYYEELLPRLRPGGLIVIDNALWGGRVIDESDQSESTRAIRGLNERIAKDERVDAVLVPIADGVMVVGKK